MASNSYQNLPERQKTWALNYQIRERCTNYWHPFVNDKIQIEIKPSIYFSHSQIGMIYHFRELEFLEVLFSLRSEVINKLVLSGV